MKKLSYLIILTVILGLVLTGCSLLSNVGQTPASPQKGVPTNMIVVSDTSVSVTDIGGSFLSNAVEAWEPFLDDPNPVDPNNSIWDQKTGKVFTGTGADWIWESYRTVHTINGDIVYFEKTFDIDGTPTAGTLYITCDNGYEAYLNDTFVGSAQLGPGWETSNLTETFVNVDGWQSVEDYDVDDLLKSGENVLFIKAVNEYMGTPDGQSNGTQYTNPAGLIFELDIDYEVVIEEEVPGIAIEKSGPASAHVGDPITYEYTVSNTGDVPLSGVIVTDSLEIAVSYVSGDESNGLLDVGETWMFTADYTVPSGVDPVENIATASGISPQGTEVTAEADWSVVVLHPDISVAKVADTTQYYIDGSVTYTIVVTNTGDCTLHDISVVDDKLGILATGLTLDSGEFATYNPVTYPAIEETITNIVIATGSDALDKEVTATDTATVTLEHGFTLTWGYWKTHSSYGPAPYDDTWASLGENPTFFLSEQTYYQVLWTSVAGGNAYYQLAHQYIGAELNKLSEAWMRDDVQDAFDEATDLLGAYTPEQVMNFKKGTKDEKLIFARFKYLARILDDYNNGLMGTPHAL